MSRVGKLPVQIPSDVKVAIQGSTVNVEGKLGKLSYTVGRGVTAEQKDGKVLLVVKSSEPQARANHGTARATINNMVTGVSKGWKRSLELNGVGFTAQVQGNILKLAVGFSHDVKVEIPGAVKCVVSKNVIDLESPDKQLVGTLASKIRMIQPPEPYLGKGIKYSEEVVRRKAGKTGKK